MTVSNDLFFDLLGVRFDARDLADAVSLLFLSSIPFVDANANGRSDQKIG